MHSLRYAIIAGLVSAWAALAAWQHHEYGHERESAEESLRRQGEAVRDALVGGIRSHRRLGRFFEEQIQAMLDEFVRAQNVLAVALDAEDGTLRLSAGQTALLEADAQQPAEASWLPAGFLLASHFVLEADGEGSPPGKGLGRGWGRGRGLREGTEPGPLASGGRFQVRLLLDRSRADAQLLRAAWLRAMVVGAGGLVALSLAWAWRASVRLVEVRSRAQVLEAEARHLRERGQAAAGLAHETRNPLGLIRGWAQRLLDSPLPAPEQRHHARAVVEECDRVTSRINQFIAFARPRQPRCENVDVAALVEELAVLMEPDLEAKGLRLDRSAIRPGGTVRADRELLRQALFNLLGNAVQFSPSGGTIETILRGGQDNTCRLEVADAGPGVPPAAADSLFTPYFTTRADGAGLGLAIVHQIAAAHGWQAGYTPRPGGGAIFWIERLHA